MQSHIAILLYKYVIYLTILYNILIIIILLNKNSYSINIIYKQYKVQLD